MRLGQPEDTSMRGAARFGNGLQQTRGLDIVLVSPDDQLQVALAHPDTEA